MKAFLAVLLSLLTVTGDVSLQDTRYQDKTAAIQACMRRMYIFFMKRQQRGMQTGSRGGHSVRQ